MMPLAKQRASQNWYVRRAVPKELRKIVGKYEIWVTTRTPDKSTALRRSRQIEARIDMRFERARAQRSPSSVDRVPEDALIRLARETFQATLASYEDAITLRHDLDGLDMELADLSYGLEEGSWDQMILDWADDKLTAAGFEVRQGPGRAKAVQLLARAQGAALRTAQAQASGDWAFSSGDPLVTSTPSAVPVGDDGITVRDLVARHAHDPSRANVGKKSQMLYNTIYKVLVEVVGATTPVNQVTREDARRVREALMDRGLAETTINSYLSLLSAIWLHAVREGYADKNVAEGLRIKAAVHSRDLRMPLSESQLRRIFGSPDFAAYRTKRPSMFWCPLLSLFMSLRLTEAAQLLRDDVKQVDGVWCVEIAPGDAKKVKSRAGHRLIPVHPQLIRLGFVDYARGRNGERLFEDVELSSHGYAGDALGKAWSRLMKRLNADAPRTAYHSLRHNWADACRAAKVHEGVMKQAGGWASGGGTSARYGSGYDVGALQEELDRIRPLPEGLL